MTQILPTQEGLRYEGEAAEMRANNLKRKGQIETMRTEQDSYNNWCPRGCQPLCGLGECGMCGYEGDGVPQDETDYEIEANEETGEYEYVARVWDSVPEDETDYENDPSSREPKHIVDEPHFVEVATGIEHLAVKSALSFLAGMASALVLALYELGAA